MSNPLPRSEVGELQFREQPYIARITNIKRKLVYTTLRRIA